MSSLAGTEPSCKYSLRFHWKNESVMGEGRDHAQELPLRAAGHLQEECLRISRSTGLREERAWVCQCTWSGKSERGQQGVEGLFCDTALSFQLWVLGWLEGFWTESIRSSVLGQLTWGNYRVGWRNKRLEEGSQLGGYYSSQGLMPNFGSWQWTRRSYGYQSWLWGMADRKFPTGSWWHRPWRWRRWGKCPVKGREWNHKTGEEKGGETLPPLSWGRFPKGGEGGHAFVFFFLFREVWCSGRWSPAVVRAGVLQSDRRRLLFSHRFLVSGSTTDGRDDDH